MKILLEKGLEIEPKDEILLEFGEIYKSEIISYKNNLNRNLEEEDEKKIEGLLESMSVICTSKHIKTMVKESKFSADYIEDLKNRALQTGSRVQEEDGEQQQEDIRSFSSLSFSEKIIFLIDKCEKEGYLDLMNDKVPRRMEAHIKSLKKELNYNLTLKATTEEREMLLQISNCTGKADIENLWEKFFTKRGLTPSCFIRLALDSAFNLWNSKQLLKSTHNEDWYRLHVYSFMFDNAFVNDEEFESKRSECYSNFTQLFPVEPGQRIDFILRDLNNDSDLITFEEKSSLKGVKNDFKKGKAIQRMMLKKRQRELGGMKLLNKLEAITCQWEGTKLIIFATRTLTPTHAINYRKGSFSIPKSFNYLAEFAKLLLAVLSLRRLVYINYKKVNIIVKEKQREELALLDYDDDDHISTKTDSTQEDNIIEEDDINYKMDPDLEAEILRLLDKMDYEEEDVKSSANCEEFIMGKVATERRRLNTEQ